MPRKLTVQSARFFSSDADRELFDRVHAATAWCSGHPGGEDVALKVIATALFHAIKGPYILDPPIKGEPGSHIHKLQTELTALSRQNVKKVKALIKKHIRDHGDEFIEP